MRPRLTQLTLLTPPACAAALRQAGTGLVVALSSLVAAACTPPGPISRPPTAAPAEASARVATVPEAQNLAPLLPNAAAYIVAPGLRWLILLNAGALARKLRVAGSAFPDAARRSAFEHSVGLRLTDLTHVAIAGFDYSTLYVARTTSVTRADSAQPLRRHRLRLHQPPITQPILGSALHSGIRDDIPQHYAQLDSRTHAWSDGDPSPIKAALLMGRGRLTETKAALEGASLSLLAERCHGGDLRVYVPGPLPTGPETLNEAPSGVLSLILAASVGFTFDNNELQVSGCVVGDWEEDGGQRVQALLDSLHQHRFTSLLALNDAERYATVLQQDNVVTFGYTWRAAHTVTRLQALLDLKLDALLGPHGHSSSESVQP